MILYLLESDTARTAVLQEAHESVMLLGMDIGVLLVNEHYYLRLSAPLRYIRKEQLVHEAHLIVEDAAERKQADIFVSQYSSGYGEFKAYQISRDILTLGGGIEDDIYVQDARLQPGHFRIDTVHHTISDTVGTMKGILNHRTVRENSYRNGDHFMVMNVQLVLHEGRIMVNRCENIYVSLPEYVFPHQDQPIARPVRSSTETLRRQGYLPQVCNVKLPDISLKEQASREPVVFSMGPALMMSSASLFSGIFAVYNGYLNGRAINELMPLIVLPSVMVISTLFWNPVRRSYETFSERRALLNASRDYRRKLLGTASYLKQQQEDTRKELNERFPKPELLYQHWNESGYLYQRTERYEDFGKVRIGQGTTEFAMHMEGPDSKTRPEIMRMTEELHAAYASVSDVPLLLSLTDRRKILLESEELLEWILFQTAVWFSPDRLKTAFLADEQWFHEHSWYRLLPHALYEEKGMHRLMASNRMEADQLLELLKQITVPVLLIVQNSSLIRSFPSDAFTVICVGKADVLPDWINASYRVENDRLVIEAADGSEQTGKADIFRNVDFYSLLSAVNGSAGSFPDRFSGLHKSGFLDLYGVSDAEGLNIVTRWNHRRTRYDFMVPIGFDEFGEVIGIDLSERGQGPHGLVAGMTGSGKSEFMATLLLSMAMNFSPREVQIVLIDFKGNGLLQFFRSDLFELPHLAGVLSNLEPLDMERAFVSFHNECRKRQRLFQQMSEYSEQPIVNLSSYQDVWKTSCHLPYLSELVIVVDEFAELKKEYPEFMKELISLSRVGRSLGIHLLLATQKPAGVVDEQIWSNARFKICLKVQEKADSNEMIHCSDAAFLRKPGEMYLLCDNHKEYGISAYANTVSCPDDLTVIQYLPDGSEEKAKSRSVRHDGTQLQQVLKAMEKAMAVCPERAEPLWYHLPDLFEPDFRHDGEGVYGIIDNFYEGAQPLLKADIGSSLFLVSGGMKEAVMGFLRLMIDMFIRNSGPQDEIYLLDTLETDDAVLSGCRMYAGKATPGQESELKQIFGRILADSGSNRMSTLIITDWNLFAREASFFEEQFIRIASLSRTAGKINVICFSSNISAIPYRIMRVFQERLALCGTSADEMNALFEMRVTMRPQDLTSGMIRRERMMLFRYAWVDELKLAQTVNNSVAAYGSEKNWQVRHMPDVVRISWKGKCCLGIAVVNGEGKLLNREEGCVFIGQFEADLRALYEEWKLVCPGTVWRLESSENRLGNDGNEGSVEFLTIADYERKYGRKADIGKDIILLEQVYRTQYVFTMPRDISCRDAEAVWFRNGKTEVIRYARQA